MKPKPASTHISPLWFFTKIGILCALGAVVFMQVRSMLAPPAPMPQVPQVAVTPTKPVVKQPKQPQARKTDAQDPAPKQPKQQPLTKALQNPETYAMIHAEFKRRLDAPYGKLYRELGLDADTLQKFRGLLAEKELSMAEGFRLAAEAKMPLSADSLAALRADADGPIKELLGDEAYANYKYYESTLPARNHVNELEARLSYKSEPLNSDQYAALVSAFAALPDSTIKLGSGAWLGNYSPEITKESLEIAKGLLTPSQFAVYQEEYEILSLAQMMEKKHPKNASPPKKKTKSYKKK